MGRFSAVGIALLICFLGQEHPGALAFELNGFGDVSFHKCSEKGCEDGPGNGDGARNGSFTLGTLDLFAVAQFGKTSVLMETDFGHVGGVEIERFYISYDFSEKFRIWAGRFHTPLGLWNTTFHHGVQIQPTIRRPAVLEFEHEGGLLPVHTTGMAVRGKFKTRAADLSYGAMIGNGPRLTAEHQEVVSTSNTFNDDNPGKSAGVFLSVFPNGNLYGLELNLSGFYSRIQTDESAETLLAARPGSPPEVDVDQTILGTAFSYSRDALNLRGEHFFISNDDDFDTARGSNTSRGSYLFLSYNLSGSWVPYAVYDDLVFRENSVEDPLFQVLQVEDLSRWIGGIRYNLSHRSSIRAEGRRVSSGRTKWNEFGLQWAVGF